MRKCYNQSGLELKGRRIVIGYHNEWNLINAHSRALSTAKKETVGSLRLLECEALKEGEVLKVSVYEGVECCGVLAVGLVYDYGVG